MPRVFAVTARSLRLACKISDVMLFRRGFGSRGDMLAHLAAKPDCFQQSDPLDRAEVSNIVSSRR